jgi:glycosyltransferase involved in cell wall biosynthesis
MLRSSIARGREIIAALTSTWRWPTANSNRDGIPGLGMVYSSPVVRDGVLHRGVVSAEDPAALSSRLDREKWVMLQCQHGAVAPKINAATDMYQCDPFFRKTVDGRPTVHVIPRDFVHEDHYHPLPVEKQYDVVFNGCWSQVKRPLLFAEALNYARDAGRSISCLWYGYHWELPSGASTSDSLEKKVRAQVAGLPVTFVDTDWHPAENNRRFNSARLALLTSSAEGGPRVMSEAMLAGLPYLAAADVFGGSSAYLTAANRNGALFQPTPRAIAECIWHTLDTLDDFTPRAWALDNMCRKVAVTRLQDALQQLGRTTDWQINWEDVNHDGSTRPEWWQRALAMNAAVT